MSLTACGGLGDTADKDDRWAYGPVIEGLIEDAKAADASAEQITMLEHWLEIQDTPYAEVEQAMQRLFACFDSAGLDYSRVEPPAGEDYPEGGYRVYDSPTMSMEESHAVMDSCDKQEFYFVNIAYQLGPGVTERRQRDDAKQFPIAIECLAEHGIEVPDAATLDEVEAYLDEIGVTDQWGCTFAAYEYG